MAEVIVTKGTLLRANEVCANPVEPTPFESGDTVKIPATDKNLVIEIIAGTTGNVVFSKGTGIAGVVDLTLAVGADLSSFVELDTNAFADDEGNIVMVPEVGGTISVINAL